MAELDGRERAVKLLEQAQALLARREEETIRALHRAYEAARKELLAILSERMAAIDQNDAAAVRRLATDTTLFRAIEERMTQLERDFAGLLGDRLRQVADSAGDQVLQEIETLTRGLGISFMRFSIDELHLLLVQPVIEDIPAIVGPVARHIISELRTGLTLGQRFSDLARRVLSSDPANQSVFRRGLTSAELMVRRAVHQVNNHSRMLFMEKAKEQLPKLQKQAVAHVGDNTTKCCLRVHGQVQDLDKPFELTAEPRFSRKMMAPPFHWNCRTASAPYMAEWEKRSQLKSSDMRQAAKDELARREKV